MTINPRFAYLENAAGQRFQVLKPSSYEDHEVETGLVDEAGNPVTRTVRVELPQEWDEDATYKLMEDANAQP